MPAFSTRLLAIAAMTLLMASCQDTSTDIPAGKAASNDIIISELLPIAINLLQVG